MEGEPIPTALVSAAALPSILSRGPSYAYSLVPLIRTDTLYASLFVSLPCLADRAVSFGYPLAFLSLSLIDCEPDIVQSFNVQAVYRASWDLNRLAVHLFDESLSASRCSPVI